MRPFQIRRDRGISTHDVKAAVMQTRLASDISGSQADTLELLMLLMLLDRPSKGLTVEVCS